MLSCDILVCYTSFIVHSYSFKISLCDILVCYRTNAFEMFGVDGSYSGPVLCEDYRSLAEWLQAISANIQSLLTQMV
jgi:hypothetical protein